MVSGPVVATCGTCAHVDYYGPPAMRTWFCRLALRRGVQPAAIDRRDKACASWEPLDSARGREPVERLDPAAILEVER